MLITGGHRISSGRLSSTEVYPSISNCSPPALPFARNAHTTFLTSDPSLAIATCGGYDGSYLSSCLVLDLVNQRWNESMMGSLTMARHKSAAVTLNYIGVFIIGGGTTNNKRTSDFLPTGSMQWQTGPVPPVDMTHPCAVPITPTSFLAIYGRNIMEFDAAIDGPTSNSGWLEAGRWPKLRTSRYQSPGCARVGQKIIITGGHNTGKALKSTEVLNLVNKKITPGEDMSTARRHLNLAKITNGGAARMFAVAGLDKAAFNLVEEWVEESSSWKPATNLNERRYHYGSVEVRRKLLC